MPAEETGAVWTQKGATFSDKSARKEFGLTQEEIIQAIQEGKLQYRLNSVFGNPFFRLLRGEVEALVDEQYGDNYLKKQKLTHELAEINKELRRLRTQIAGLEHRKSAVLESLEGMRAVTKPEPSRVSSSVPRGRKRSRPSVSPNPTSMTRKRNGENHQV